MTAIRSSSAWKFATSDGKGNCATASFFERMALAFIRAAQKNLERARDLDSRSHNGEVSYWLNAAAKRLETRRPYLQDQDAKREG